MGSGGDNIPLNNKDQPDRLYNILWEACAGPQSQVPLRGEQVFYFPQGHAEQVQAYCGNQDGSANFPVYNVPSQILCKVASIALKVEDVADEVVARITLITGEEKSIPTWISSDDIASDSLRRAVFSFSKTLTQSDTSTHGGFSIPKRYADEFFPGLDTSVQPPVQDLVAKDMDGHEWHFRHIYRGHPKRHLLTSGWSNFVTSKKLVPGDACVFVRGENGELRIGIRRALMKKSQASDVASPSVITGQCMQHGILASVYHAISCGSMFVVFHRPWRYPHFVVPYDRYMESIAVEYSPGMRFRFDFVGEEFVERRASGTIIDVGDQDPIRWPNSKWKCLKVRWNGNSYTCSLPERVSPWEITVLPKHRNEAFAQPSPKRGRDIGPSSPHFPATTSSNIPATTTEGFMTSPIEEPPRRVREVLQGQEIQGLVEALVEELFGNNPAPESDSTVTAGPIRASSYSVTQGSDGDIEAAHNRQSDGPKSVFLFGVNLLEPVPPSNTGEVVSRRNSPIPESIVSTGPVNSPKKLKANNKGGTLKTMCKQCCSSNSRSCTKVMKYGTFLGRSVELASFKGYDELVSELDKMFDFNGSLVDGSSGWKVTFLDEESDLLLVGDYDWQTFLGTVRKLFICPKEELAKMKPIKSAIAMTDG